MTVFIGGKDRCDYRTLGTRALVEEARYNPGIELCIALAERLEALHMNARGLDDELQETRDRLAETVAANVAMRAELRACEEKCCG